MWIPEHSLTVQRSFFPTDHHFLSIHVMFERQWPQTCFFFLFSVLLKYVLWGYLSCLGEWEWVKGRANSVFFLLSTHLLKRPKQYPKLGRIIPLLQCNTDLIKLMVTAMIWPDFIKYSCCLCVILQFCFPLSISHSGPPTQFLVHHQSLTFSSPS